MKSQADPWHSSPQMKCRSILSMLKKWESPFAIKNQTNLPLKTTHVWKVYTVVFTWFLDILVYCYIGIGISIGALSLCVVPRIYLYTMDICSRPQSALFRQDVNLNEVKGKYKVLQMCSCGYGRSDNESVAGGGALKRVKFWPKAAPDWLGWGFLS